MMGASLRHLEVGSFSLKLPFILCLMVLLPEMLPAQWVKTNGPYGGMINSLAARGDTVYAGTDCGVFYSYDGGEVWMPSDTGFDGAIQTLDIVGESVFAGSRGGLERSSDFGRTWSMLLDTMAFRACAALGSLRFTGGVGSYEGRSLGGIWRSTDGGKSWKRCLSNQGNFYCLATYDTIVFAGGERGLFCSKDQGVSWFKPDSTLGVPVWKIALVPTSDSLGVCLFLSSTYRDIYRSRDLGRSWELKATNLGRSLAVVGGTLFAGNNSQTQNAADGVSFTTDLGESWTSINSGLAVTNVQSLAATVSGADSVLYAGTIDGVYRSRTAGRTWQRADSGITGNRLFSLAARDSFLFAGTSMAPVRSTDHGAHWSRVDLSLTSMSAYEDQNSWINAIAVKDSIVLAGRLGLLRSTDLGASWTANSSYGWYIMGLLPTDSSWQAVGEIFSRSTDQGLTWTGYGIGDALWSLAKDSQRLYAGTSNGGVYISSDDGRSWTQTTAPRDVTWALAATADEVFAATMHYGVYLSTDQGETWREANAGLPGGYIFALAAEGRDAFLGHERDGIYHWDPVGQSWSPVNEGLSTEEIVLLALDKKYLYAGMLNGSIWYRPLAEITAVKEVGDEAPDHFSLEQNYPNPFNPTTTIRYALPHRTHVSLVVYNMLGQSVTTLVRSEQEPGIHEVKFDGSQLSSGVYVCCLRAENYFQSRKLLLLK